MDRAPDSITPLRAIRSLTTFGRLRVWWDRLAASLVPGRSGGVPDRATGRIVGQLKQIFEDRRNQRGGEISARARAEQIAAIYRNASLPQRAAILSLITHEFATDRQELDAAIAALHAAQNE